MKGILSRRSRSGQHRATRRRASPSVFAVHKSETADGRYHEVVWAQDGNLNAATRRGDIKRFRLWPAAKKFATGKGKALGAKPIID